MVFLSTLSTAAEVRHAIAERRLGRDPSGQEAPGEARAHLARARAELRELFARLRAGRALEGAEAEEVVFLVRRFDALMIVHRAARLLHLVHQRLLSLYPEVSEALVEEVRLLGDRGSALSGEDDDDRFPDALAAFADLGAAFLERLGEEMRNADRR